MAMSAVRIHHAGVIVAGLALATGAAILWLSRSYTFYFDEWDFILSAPGWGWATFLEPHNEHPVMLPRLIYAALLDTVGLRSYVPYMLVLVALHVAAALLLFELIRRRAGDFVAIAFTAMFLVLGAGWENLLWAFQLAFVGSVACGLGLLLALEGPSTPRRLLVATILLTASLMFSAIGLFFGVAAATRLALAPARRRELLWFVPVAIAFAAWYLALGHSGKPSVPPGSASNLLVVPAYVAWGLAGSVGGIIGITGTAALAVLVVAAGAVGFAWWRHRPDQLALGAAGGLITFYALTGLARAQIGYDQSASGRYIYVGAVFWLILLADAASLLRWRGTWRPALAACVFLACFSSGVLMFEWATAKALLMEREIADLQALTAVRTDKCLNPAGIPDRLVMPQVNNPALYYRAIDHYGDPTAGRPITYRADFDNARRNLVRLDCTGG
ncbi:MAG: hypothetical protein NVS1B3_08990 [Candidatus Dormibacteraceae bacterium]